MRIPALILAVIITSSPFLAHPLGNFFTPGAISGNARLMRQARFGKPDGLARRF
jgi:hypothetical protein